MVAKTSSRIIALIDALEAKINKGDVDSGYTEELQRQLNDGTVLSTDDRYHQYAFELQALIYKAQRKQDECTKCIGAAVEQAGSIQKLHSRLLKTYARNETQVSSVRVAEEKKRSGPDRSLLLTDKEQAFLRHQGLETMPDIGFLTRSLPSFIAMFLLSGGIYGTYWLYKNWQAVHEAAEIRFSPLWRTLLSIVYIWPLFKIMVIMAKSRGFNLGYSGGALAAGYILTAFVGAMYGLTIKGSRVQDLLIQVITSCLYVLFFAMAQQAAILALPKQSAQSGARPINYVELLFVAVGFLFLIASLSSYNTTTSKRGGSVLQQLQTRSVRH